MKRLTAFLTIVLMVSGASATANTVASSTMWFQGRLVADPTSGGYTGTLAMANELTAGIGDKIAGFDIYGKQGGTAAFNSGGFLTIGPDHDGWPTWNPDTPDWYQYSLEFSVAGGVTKWALRNHPGATAEHPWYDTGYEKAARGVPMSGLMDWVSMTATETDTGAYLPGTGTAKYLGWAAANGGGAGAWDMDWSWGSEVVPLEYDAFKVTIDWVDGAYCRVSLTPVPVPGAVLLGLLGLSLAGARLRKRS